MRKPPPYTANTADAFPERRRELSPAAGLRIPRDRGEPSARDGERYDERARSTPPPVGAFSTVARHSSTRGLAHPFIEMANLRAEPSNGDVGVPVLELPGRYEAPEGAPVGRRLRSERAGAGETGQRRGASWTKRWRRESCSIPLPGRQAGRASIKPTTIAASASPRRRIFRPLAPF